MKILVYILSFTTLLSSHFLLGQGNSKWLMFKSEIVENKKNIFGSLQHYCSFLKIEQDTKLFNLYEYCVIQNKQGKIIYSKFNYKGHYAFTKDSSAINLIPSGVEIFTRIGDKQIKEEKSFSKAFEWNLFLNPYRLTLHMYSRNGSLFEDNSIYLSSIVCQMLDDDHLKKFDARYKKWNHGQFEYPSIDSTLMVDTNKYYLEIPNLNLDEMYQVKLYSYRQQQNDVDILMFDYFLKPDSSITIITEPRSEHTLVHKHYLMLQNEGFVVKLKKEY